MKSTIFLAMKEYMYTCICTYKLIGFGALKRTVVVMMLILYLSVNPFDHVSIIWKGQHWYLFTCERHTIVII